ncbi:hypothetical protein OOK31_13370 [Streptomyces sp. NBC_00249]|uniref:hypothetical protein n=1 Tax=Streptomyces sp. NBC_00249 TaxID=2975690 RepID=UPI0022531EFC|nr:hypothetical protein [Streptomyces sp. NBC_00249]MCX5194878.1 hypothetical protein [Streptomyces sp. NBC_00249]
MVTDGDEPSVSIGEVSGSAFSIGGTGHTNTVHHGGTGTPAPGPEELLEAVRDLRAALLRLPRSDGRTALDAELDEADAELEGAEEIRAGLPARLRGALTRWAPLVETVGAATALAGLLSSLGG